MKVLIIGCGLIGRKRALALKEEDKLVACCDINKEIGQKFSQDFNCDYYVDYSGAIKKSDADVVIISVVNKYIKEIAIEAIKNNKHIIVEKPLGRNYSESKEIVEEYLKKLKNSPNLKFKVGFNHRFHPAIWEAKKYIDNGKIGKIFSIRARYGHGGRNGMEKEWRASKDLCGGGELLDQGVHIIDLIRWFGGTIKSVYGVTKTKFWDMEVEDNAFAILETESEVTANFNVSWTNWRNIFSFEIFGNLGYLAINGLGGSYGIETLEVGKRREEGGRPLIVIKEYPPEDISWKKEWEEFVAAINEERDVIGNYFDGLEANRVINSIYESNKTKKLLEI